MEQLCFKTPNVFEIRAYSDSACTNEIVANLFDASNFFTSDPFLAFDDDDSSYWNPSCEQCEIGEAWVEIEVTETARCIVVNNEGGNVGIKVETYGELGDMVTVMESSSGNKAYGITL